MVPDAGPRTRWTWISARRISIAKLVCERSVTSARHRSLPWQKLTSAPSSVVSQGALLLLSTLTLHLPHLRSHLLTILPDLLPTTLLNSLSHPTSSGVRAAAAQLARGLSRSVCVLRSSLVDAKGVVERLIEMVLDVDGREKDEVKSGVVAVLGNLGLEFAPMKQVSSMPGSHYIRSDG